MAQNIIKGKILDINTLQPIPYVNVFLQDSKSGTVSDFAGRFQLKLLQSDSTKTLVFKHINYDIKSISLKSIKSPITVYLQPRVIPLPGVEVFAPGEKMYLKKELPLMTLNISTQRSGIRGFIDAGDFLRSCESIQVQENLSGSKTISLRGGNPDDVLILYNGIKLNNQFTNTFDLSLLDLQDIQQIQIIKGSNSVLYGNGAFSGVVNIIPQIERDFNIKFQQRFGSYNSGNWGLQLYGKKKNLHVNFRISKGGSRRVFANGASANDFLENLTSLQNVGIEYRSGSRKNVLPQNTFKVFALTSKTNYENHRSSEKVNNTIDVAQFIYQGDLFRIENIHLFAAFNQTNETQNLNNQNGWLDRELKTNGIQFHFEKMTAWQWADLLLSYQYERNSLDFSDAHYDFLNNQISGEIDQLKRLQHSFASIFKIYGDGGSQILNKVDFDLSYRYDLVLDRQNGNAAERSVARSIPDRDWYHSSLKFASRFHGSLQRFYIDIFTTFGNNIKIPTLAQLISSNITSPQTGEKFSLAAEKNRSVEIGIILKKDMRNHPSIYGWEISFSYLKNNYSNKLRTYYVIGLPLAFYDNVPDARLSGFELRATAFLFKKKITAETGISKYTISDKAAFPFKSENKKIINISFDHRGYSFLMHWFQEAEQTGWIRELNGRFNEVILPRFTNIDLHFSKIISFKKIRFFIDISLRNLMTDRTELEGLALHDRRYYVTGGFQY